MFPRKFAEVIFISALGQVRVCGFPGLGSCSGLTKTSFHQFSHKNIFSSFFFFQTRRGQHRKKNHKKNFSRNWHESFLLDLKHVCYARRPQPGSLKGEETEIISANLRGNMGFLVFK